MKNVIKILRPEEMKFIKKINIISKNRLENDIVIGFLLYERSISLDYTFKPKEDSIDKITYLITYPKQTDYPTDEIDELILETIKLSYPNSIVHSKMLFSSGDIEWLENLKDRPFEISNLIIRPDFFGQDIEKLVGKEFEIFRKDLKIYVDSSSELIKNNVFYGQCYYEKHLAIYQKLNTINFL
ncbi:hypothetical protein [uncultured Flavobacterium sp.]|uniref:hypothetical protein n=1 Tax=uncultured Flavobacterium sp. TaxID=165435 RepID=UPI0030C8CCAE